MSFWFIGFKNSFNRLKYEHKTEKITNLNRWCGFLPVRQAGAIHAIAKANLFYHSYIQQSISSGIINCAAIYIIFSFKNQSFFYRVLMNTHLTGRAGSLYKPLYIFLVSQPGHGLQIRASQGPPEGL
ncbi:MAG: hypothetical protein KDE33_20200 [Bacteroidetes bacterium]|nr:hypothetical protein [Bacteroidota bacterium]